MRKGFTLIELLIVVVLIGILAALVLPKFGDVKERAYKAAMQNDLRNLATAQEIYFEQNGFYAEEAEDVIALSQHVTIDITVEENQAGYYAEASRRGTDVTCWLDRRGGEAAKGSRVECSDEATDENEN